RIVVPARHMQQGIGRHDAAAAVGIFGRGRSTGAVERSNRATESVIGRLNAGVYTADIGSLRYHPPDEIVVDLSGGRLPFPDIPSLRGQLAVGIVDVVRDTAFRIDQLRYAPGAVVLKELDLVMIGIGQRSQRPDQGRASQSAVS